MAGKVLWHKHVFGWFYNWSQRSNGVEILVHIVPVLLGDGIRLIESHKFIGRQLT